jgi:hypothetical protein
VPNQDLNTAVFRDALADELVSPIYLDEWSMRIRDIVGYQPVPQRTRRLQQDGAISSDDDAYLGKLLTWGSENRDIFVRILLDRFNALGQDVDANVANIHQRTCVKRVYMPARVVQYKASHPAQSTFAKYLVVPPSGADDGTPDAIMHVHAPNYDVEQLRVNGLSDKRKRSLAFAFKRVERVATAMEHIDVLHRWIEHWRSNVAAGQAVTGQTNPLYRYIMGVGGAAGGLGGGPGGQPGGPPLPIPPPPAISAVDGARKPAKPASSYVGFF